MLIDNWELVVRKLVVNRHRCRCVASMLTLEINYIEYGRRRLAFTKQRRNSVSTEKRIQEWSKKYDEPLKRHSS